MMESLFTCREFPRSKDDRRPAHYLSGDFEERMSRDGVQYKLQIQLHESKPGDSHLILHPARAWDQATHPWLDLADVKLTSLLPCDVVNDTSCSVENLPLSIAVPPAKTIYDYSSTAQLSSKSYSGSKGVSCVKPSGEDLSTYCISVTTGNRKGAGTDANVSLTITGKAASFTLEVKTDRYKRELKCLYTGWGGILR